MGRTVCKEDSACTTVHYNFTCTSTSAFGPYGLYRATAPLQRYNLPLPTPLLPLWTVRYVQSLSEFTKVYINFNYTSIPLWTLRPVQSHSASTTMQISFIYTTTPLWTVQNVQSFSACKICTLPLPIPLFPLWPIRHVQSLSPCTTKQFNFT